MAMAWVAFIGVFAVAAFAIPGVHASPGEPTVHILHDVPDDGYTYVGNPVHFGYVLLDENQQTTVHHNGKITVTQNNVTLYDTSLDAGHDYDVLNTFTIAFPAAGPYVVHAEVPLSGSVVATDTFEGIVLPNKEDTKANLILKHELQGALGNFEIQLVDASGKVIPHSDAEFEVRRAADHWLLFRTHLHTHEAPMLLRYTFPLPGDYLIRVVGYNAFPTQDGQHYAPVSTTTTIKVAEPPPLVSTTAAQLDPPKGSSPYQILSSIDPQDSSTPFSRFVLSSLVYDPKGDAFVPHVNFEAILQNAETDLTIFYSNSLHEYDGNLDFTFNWPIPGKYVLTVNVVKPDWILQAKKEFVIAEVLPTDGLPLPTSAGAVIVRATGLDALKSGQPSKIQFSTTSLVGTAAQHDELDYQILRMPWGPPVLANKIHTHDSGLFDVDINFAEPGDYVLVLDPVNIHGEPTMNYYFGDVGGALDVPLSVAVGTPFPQVLPVSDPEPALQEPHKLPAFDVALVAFAAALVILAVTRRRL